MQARIDFQTAFAAGLEGVQIENLDHLGLVAGMINELGLVELTNEEIEPHCLEHVSAGQIEQRHLDSTSISVEVEVSFGLTAANQTR